MLPASVDSRFQSLLVGSCTCGCFTAMALQCTPPSPPPHSLLRRIILALRAVVSRRNLHGDDVTVFRPTYLESDTVRVVWKRVLQRQNRSRKTRSHRLRTAHSSLLNTQQFRIAAETHFSLRIHHSPGCFFKTRGSVFPARVGLLAMALCLSVCLSQVGVLSKGMN